LLFIIGKIMVDKLSKIQYNKYIKKAG